MRKNNLENLYGCFAKSVLFKNVCMSIFEEGEYKMLTVNIVRFKIRYYSHETSISCNCHEIHFQELTVPAAVMEVIDEELNKLSFLDNHSSEFR